MIDRHEYWRLRVAEAAKRNGNDRLSAYGLFRGGPRDRKRMLLKFHNLPYAIGCVTEATAAGMYGIYRLSSVNNHPTLGGYVYEWHDLSAQKAARG